MHRKNETSEGNETVPFFFSMIQDTQIQAVENLLTPLLEGDIFLVSIKIKPINNVKVYLDADSGLPIEKCIRINRALYKQIEEKGIFPNDDFSLEVSSPGIDEPLKLLRQYRKNTGREVEVTLNDESRQEGKLTVVNENSITINFTEGKGKKAIARELEIPFSEIKQTKVRVKF